MHYKDLKAGDEFSFPDSPKKVYRFIKHSTNHVNGSPEYQATDGASYYTFFTSPGSANETVNIMNLDIILFRALNSCFDLMIDVIPAGFKADNRMIAVCSEIDKAREEFYRSRPNYKP